jgi:hypothetical protein
MPQLEVRKNDDIRNNATIIDLQSPTSSDLQIFLSTQPQARAIEHHINAHSSSSLPRSLSLSFAFSFFLSFSFFSLNNQIKHCCHFLLPYLSHLFFRAWFEKQQ